MAMKIAEASASGSSSASWSDLPSDLVAKTFRFLLLLEQIRFRIVCSAWRSATTEDRPNPPPWLLVFHRHPRIRSLYVCGDPCDCGHQYTLFVPGDVRSQGTGGRFYPSLIPKEFRGWSFAGGSHGWLFIWLGHRSALINPLTGASVPLPDLRCRRYVINAVLSSPPTKHSEDYIVSMLFSNLNRRRYVAFWKPGEDNWISKPTEYTEGLLFCRSKRSLILLKTSGSICTATPCFSSEKDIRFEEDHPFIDWQSTYRLHWQSLVRMNDGGIIMGLRRYGYDDNGRLQNDRIPILGKHDVASKTILTVESFNDESDQEPLRSLFLGAGCEFSESFFADAAHVNASSALQQPLDRRDCVYLIEPGIGSFQWGIYSMRRRSYLHNFAIRFPDNFCSDSRIFIQVAWYMPSV